MKERIVFVSVLIILINCLGIVYYQGKSQAYREVWDVITSTLNEHLTDGKIKNVPMPRNPNDAKTKEYLQ